MKKNIFENFSNLGVLEEFRENADIDPELAEQKDILDEKKIDQPFFRLFYLLGALFFIVLIFKLINVQITHGYENRFLADGNRVRLKELEPSRGIILDNHGVPLVSNVPSYRLSLYPSDLPKSKQERKKILDKISEVTKIPMSDLEKVEKSIATLDTITIKEEIDRDTALTWECQLNDLPGVTINKTSRRIYSSIAGLSHILGYVGKISPEELKEFKEYGNESRIGKNGLEKTYESELRGKPGQEELEVDSKGRIQRTLSKKNPTTGKNLMLGLDSRLQNAASSALQQALIENKSEKGVVVAMDPRNGSILAMTSLPYYDNNLFARGITSSEYTALLSDKNHPMINRSVSGTYPSGSVIKPIVAAAALQEKVVSPSTKLDTSPGVIQIGQWLFPDWKVHGITDARQAIAESNDIYFYAVGGGWQNIRGLGINRLSEWFTKFGFGSKTGIDLPTESSGLVPNDAWKRKVKKEGWYIGDTYHMSIGQGYFLSTPIQMAVATSAIANNGEILKPHLVDKVVDSSGSIVNSIPKQVVRSDVVEKSYLQVVREGMRMAVTSGSAYKLRDLPFSSAAKTGTAEFGDNTYSHAWFTAFAPYENPEIVVAVMIEGGGQGSTVSGPVVRSVLESYFSNKNK